MSFSNPIQDFLPAREIPRRRLIHSGIAQQKFRRAVLEAAAEISSEFSEHYWKEVVNGNKTEAGIQVLPPPTSNQSLKQRFVFYLNASGRYLVLREHLRQAVSHIVQQRCLNLRPSGFQSHRDFQTLLHDMYNYLTDEVHETLNRTKLHEGDPLDPPPPKMTCNPTAEPPSSLKELGSKSLLRELLFYSEESFVQGDFDNCHRIHLQRICRSREDSRCWLDFALMWLSRGDDRMAEIAVKEALQRDSTSIYALVIGGIIAVRHNDSRGIAVLAVALEMKPLCPELLVILALAHIAIGAKEDSDYFFRKAAYLHRTLTGQSTADLDKMLTKLSKSVGIDATVDDTTKANQTNKEEEAEIDLQELNEQIEVDSLAGAEILKPNSADPEIYIIPTNDSKGKKESLTGKDPKKSADKPLLIFSEYVEEETEEEFYTRKISLSRETPKAELKSPHPRQPKFDFIPELSDLIVEDSILPPLRPSILLPWNITECTEKLKTLLTLVSEDQYKVDDEFGRNKNETVTASSGIASTNAITAEYDQIVDDHMDNTEIPQNELEDVQDQEFDLSKHPVHASIDEMEELFHTQDKRLEDMTAMRTPQVENENSNALPVFVNRLGSELIWAGQLLLQLRMFDMLDGILTRELYTTGKRSIQFLYLRAMSLYLRRCQREAIPVIDEALTLDPENAVLWIIRGHCFYEMDQPEDAVKNYETALRVPVGKENRHLLYLRFGSLCLDQGNYDTAKRVYLYGIQKYPTPYLWLAIGNTCFTMGSYEEAEAAFAEANRLDNTNPITWAHLALINLACDRQALAEQSYKWAIRFGLKKGKVLDEIKKLQMEKGFGDPSFPRIPNCIPHDYYVRRLGRQKPFDIYRDALLQEPPTMGKKRFDNTERENTLKEKLQPSPKEDPEPALEVPANIDLTVVTETDAGPVSTAEAPTESEPVPDIQHLNTPETEYSIRGSTVTTVQTEAPRKEKGHRPKSKRGGGGPNARMSVGDNSNIGPRRTSNVGEGERRKSTRSRDSSTTKVKPTLASRQIQPGKNKPKANVKIKNSNDDVDKPLTVQPPLQL